MIIEFGHFALLIALCISFAQALLGLLAGGKTDYRLYIATKRASDIALATSIIAFATFVWAHIVSDFSVRNVVENSHTLKPFLYKVAGAWGNHEGSMLLWVLVAVGFGSSLAHAKNDLVWTLKARALGIQGLIVGLVICYVVFASNPFARLGVAPVQGNDLNPLLQDPALALHPPFLYLGYVGLSLVYSLAIAGLIEGRVDAAWAKLIRPWVLASWIFLTIGIGLGAYWAYYELGWGGWWFWDPVENASFMPWLMATALLHSAIVTEKRGAVASWTVLLAILAFSLSLLGTFLVRSGVLTSVHAFALDPKRGMWILLILLLVTGGGLLLFGLRSNVMSSDKGLFAPISRESAIILNNLFFVVSCLTILVGTLYPLLGEAIYGRAISVGAPYFNAVFTPIMSIIMAFLPIATLLSWKRSKLKENIIKLLPALAAAIVIGLIIAFTAKDKPMSAVGIALAFWIIFGAFVEVGQKIGFGKVSFDQSMKRFNGLRPMAMGMFIAHLGLGIFTLGAVYETSFKKETTIALSVGESAKFNGATFTLKELTSDEGPNFYADTAHVVMVDGPRTYDFAPARRYYPAAKMPTTEVDRKGGIFGETYMAVGDETDVNGVPKWTIRLYYNPMISWIFFGVLMMGVGGMFSLSDRGLRIGVPKANMNAAKGKIA